MAGTLYYISDIAYAHLKELGITSGYIKQSYIRQSGMSEFLCHLSTFKFKDQRPDYLKEIDQELIDNWRAPIWKGSGGYRKARTLYLTQEAQIRFLEIAAYHGVFIGRRLKGSPKADSPTAITGAVIEAIGLKYLVAKGTIYNMKRRISEPVVAT